MDFFQQQDIARRNTRLLVVLFTIAVLVLVVLINLVVAAFLWFGQDYNVYTGSREGMAGFLSYFSWTRFGGIGLGVTAIVSLVVLMKWIQLSTGGKAVAESMGGTRVLPQTRDQAEQRCLNVVEEIALAANMPVPPLYVLNGERGINAFAAGITPADAIVAVTRGTITHLKRDELQGVVAHEFSHILNGDMRLNIRLAALLKGITFVGDVGNILLHSNSRVRSGAHSDNSNSGAALPMLGLALLVLGWVGGLAAGFIKAAISRQKEYLADASAVQFTRNPDGIGDALKVIGGYIPGSLVHAARAAEMSHIFFGQIEHRLWQMFSTHPSLEDRIRRLDKNWDGRFLERKVQHYEAEPSRPGFAEVGVGRSALVMAALATTGLDEQPGQTLDIPVDVDAENLLPDADFEPYTGDPQSASAANAPTGIPAVFVQHSHEPLGAQALVYSLLINDQEAARQLQMSILEESDIQGLSPLVHTLAPGVRDLGAPLRLPLLEMCLPALKSMSSRQYRRFKDQLLQLIKADRRTELHEWCLYQLTRHYLDPEFSRVTPSKARYNKLAKLAAHIRVVLSVLAHEGGGNTERVFRLAADQLDFPRMSILPPEQCSVVAFSKAVHELADCYPLLKPRVLKAMSTAAGEDGRLTPTEREIIASMAAVMDCPIPFDLAEGPA